MAGKIYEQILFETQIKDRGVSKTVKEMGADFDKLRESLKDVMNTFNDKMRSPKGMQDVARLARDINKEAKNMQTSLRSFGSNMSTAANQAKFSLLNLKNELLGLQSQLLMTQDMMQFNAAEGIRMPQLYNVMRSIEEEIDTTKIKIEQENVLFKETENQVKQINILLKETPELITMSRQAGLTATEQFTQWTNRILEADNMVNRMRNDMNQLRIAAPDASNWNNFMSALKQTAVMIQNMNSPMALGGSGMFSGLSAQLDSGIQMVQGKTMTISGIFKNFASNIRGSLNFGSLFASLRNSFHRFTSIFTGSLTAGLYSAVQMNFDDVVARFDTMTKFEERLKALGLETTQSIDDMLYKSDDSLDKFVRGTKLKLDDLVRATETFASITGDLDLGEKYAKSFAALSIAADTNAQDTYRVMQEVRYLISGADLTQRQWNVFQEHWANALRLLAQQHDMTETEYFQTIQKDSKMFLEDLQQAFDVESVYQMMEVNKQTLDSAFKNLQIAGTRGAANMLIELNRALEDTYGVKITTLIIRFANKLEDAWTFVGEIIGQHLPDFKKIGDIFAGVDIRNILNTAIDVATDVVSIMARLINLFSKLPTPIVYGVLLSKFVNVPKFLGSFATLIKDIYKYERMAQKVTKSAKTIEDLTNVTKYFQEKLVLNKLQFKDMLVQLGKIVVPAAAFGALIAEIGAIIYEFVKLTEMVSKLDVGEDFWSKLGKVATIFGGATALTGIITGVVALVQRISTVKSIGMLKGEGIVAIFEGLIGELGAIIYEYSKLAEVISKLDLGHFDYNYDKVSEMFDKAVAFTGVLTTGFSAIIASNKKLALAIAGGELLTEGALLIIDQFAKVIENQAEATKKVAEANAKAVEALDEINRIEVPDDDKINQVTEAINKLVEELKTGVDIDDAEALYNTAEAIEEICKAATEIARTNFPTEAQFEGVKQAAEKSAEMIKDIHKAFHDEKNKIDIDVDDVEEDKDILSYFKDEMKAISDSLADIAKIGETEIATLQKQISNITDRGGILDKILELKNSLDIKMADFFGELNGEPTKTSNTSFKRQNEAQIQSTAPKSRYADSANGKTKELSDSKTYAASLKSTMEMLKAIGGILEELGKIASYVEENADKVDDQQLLPGGKLVGKVSVVAQFFSSVKTPLKTISDAGEGLKNANIDNLSKTISAVKEALIQLDTFWSSVKELDLFKRDGDDDSEGQGLFSWLGEKLFGKDFNYETMNNKVGETMSGIQSIVDSVMGTNTDGLNEKMTVLKGFSTDLKIFLTTLSDEVLPLASSLSGVTAGEDETGEAKGSALETSLNGVLTSLDNGLEKASDVQEKAEEMSEAVDDISSALNGSGGLTDQFINLGDEVIRAKDKIGDIITFMGYFERSVNGASKSVKNLATALSDLPNEVTVGISLSGLDAAFSELASLKREINDLSSTSDFVGPVLAAGDRFKFTPFGFAKGGYVGKIFNKPANIDTIPAYLANGEFVQNRKSVRALGASFMEKINNLDIKGAFRSLSAKNSQLAAQAVGTTNITNNYFNNTNNAKLTQHIYGGDTNISYRRANKYIRSF